MLVLIRHHLVTEGGASEWFDGEMIRSRSTAAARGQRTASCVDSYAIKFGFDVGVRLPFYALLCQLPQVRLIRFTS